MATVIKMAGDEWMGRLAESLGLDPGDVSRIVVDAQAGELVRVYVEKYARERSLLVELPSEPDVNIMVIG